MSHEFWIAMMIVSATGVINPRWAWAAMFLIFLRQLYP
jgi:hypothetical protein